MLRSLDLNVDDPEDYEGLLVVVDGAEYRIGEWVGEGAERIVHDLIGLRTGLSLHLINILRDQSTAAETAHNAREAVAEIRDLGLPVLQEALVVHGHGGVFEVQEAANLKADPQHEVHEQTERLAQLGEWGQCEAVCHQILAGMPGDVLAMHTLARACAHRGDFAKAVLLEDEAIDIEPNLRVFRVCQLEYAVAMSNLRLFVGGFEAFKHKWPTDNSIDELAVDVYLQVGLPDAAATLRLPPDLKAKRKQVQREARRKRRAINLLNRAEEAMLDDRLAASNRRLRRAYHTYPKDVEIAFNWGLAQLRLENAGAAVSTLEQIVTVAPAALQTQLLGSLGFAAALAGQEDRAVATLELVVRQLEREGELLIWDLPQWAVWILGDQILAKRSTQARDAVFEVERYLHTRDRTSQPLVRMLAAYDRGMADYLGDEATTAG